jgi:hypothetical protein
MLMIPGHRRWLWSRIPVTGLTVTNVFVTVAFVPARTGPGAASRARVGSEIVVLRALAYWRPGSWLSRRGGTAWQILTAEARCWILTRTLR